MMPQQQPTPAPIHDIVAPVALFPYPLWMLVAGGLAILALLGLVVWFFLARKRSKRVLSPTEEALRDLTELRGRLATTEPYPFSIEVSDVLRRYFWKERGLRATTQTSLEFLAAIRSRGVFSDEAQAVLAQFLETADLIKFARAHATTEDCRELLAGAENLVRVGAAPQVEGAAK